MKFHPFNRQALALLLLLMMVSGLAAQQTNSDQVMLDELKAKAGQGDANSQCSLALIYCNGEGVAKDFNEALKWLRKAAQQGDAKAEYNLGVCYERGEGVDKSLVEAVALYRKGQRLARAFKPRNPPEEGGFDSQ